MLGWQPDQARKLSVGDENKALERDDALRGLAALVRESAVLSAAFAAHPAHALLGTLAEGDEAVRFRTALNSFLDEFGRCSDNWMELALTTWQENPTLALALVNMCAMRPAHDVRVDRAALRRDRDEAIAAARSLLTNEAQALRDEFEFELAFARRANALEETHNYWIDQLTAYWVRMDLLAAGRLLTQRGAREDREDVFHFTLDELRSGLADERSLFQPLVEERRADLERWRGVTPPLELGVPMAPDRAAASALTFGGIVANGGERQLKGQAASRGAATGRARIITSFAEADRLSPGEILVAKTTSPPWTPLFGVAAAIVTDAGSALSHAAIVAREYGIPAVVGTVNATVRIKEGQLLRVDGTAGTVDLLGSE